MTRRDLIQKVVLGGTTLFILPQTFISCSKSSVEPGGTPGPGSNNISLDLSIAANAALNTPGGSLITKGIIVANTGNNVFVALDSVCTHQGCTIGYDLTANDFPCPCHGSIFSTTGSVINGPATVALKSYPVSKAGNILTISTS